LSYGSEPNTKLYIKSWAINIYQHTIIVVEHNTTQPNVYCSKERCR